MSSSQFVGLDGASRSPTVVAGHLVTWDCSYSNSLSTCLSRASGSPTIVV
jgi:hypothetical protein